MTNTEQSIHNADIQIEGDELIIRVPLKDAEKKAVSSKSGKTRLVATTSGFTPLDHAALPGLKVALNVTIPTKRAGGQR